MKNLKIYAILGLSALLVLSACKKDEITEDPGTEGPVLTLSSTTLTVSAEGGVASVAYQVTNPYEGVSVSVDLEEVDWISDVEVTDSTIDLTVDASSEIESRTATLTVSYPGAEDVTLTVTQEAYGYDYNYSLVGFYGYIYENYGYNYEDMFYIWLSDLEFEDADLQEGGHYYNFALLVEDSDEETLPTGVYTYTSDFSGDYVFSGYYSRYLLYNSYYDYEEVYLNGGTITVSEDGGVYTIEGVVTDTNGATHNLYYTGPASIKSFTLKDTEFTATTAIASYYTHSGDVMNVDIVFTDMEYDGYYLYYPGVYLALDTYMPYDEDGKFAEGTYTVSTTGDAMTIYPSYYSYVYDYVSSSDYTYGYIESGTMTVTATGNDTYKVVGEFVTDGGATVKFTYEGDLTVDDMPGPASSLTGDVTVNADGNLDGAYVSITDYGDYYGNGGTNLYMLIAPGDYGAGDAFYIDLNAVSGSTVPDGTYSASTSEYPAVGEYLYGYMYYSYYMMGSWYMELNDSWSIVNYAPLVDGDITFTNNADGTYTVTVDCKDDLGYSISGSWTGSYAGTASVSSVASRKLAVTKPGKQELNAKAAEMRSAKEATMKVASKASSSNVMSTTLELKK